MIIWTISFSPKKVLFNVLKWALTAPFCSIWLICKGLFQIALCASQLWTLLRIVSNRFFLVTYHCKGNRYKLIRNYALYNSIIQDVVWCHAVYTFSHSYFDIFFSCRNRKRKSNLWLHVPKRR